MSDIVFLRAWIGVDLPRFYNPVTNLLGPAVKPLPRQLKPGHLAPEVQHLSLLGCEVYALRKCLHFADSSEVQHLAVTVAAHLVQ